MKPFSKEHILEYARIKKEKIKAAVEYSNEPINVTIIQVGDNPASNKYVSNKMKDCEYVGIKPHLVKLPEDISFIEMTDTITKIAEDEMSNGGIIIQKPLPPHLEEVFGGITYYIPKEKDIDGFRRDSLHDPCTPLGIMEYLNACKIDLVGKHCVIIGRSDLVGRPLAKLMLDKDCTVTVCHSKTSNLEQITKQADILVVACGKAKMIDSTYVKDDAIVIDVGINFDENGKMCGDVDYENVRHVTDYVTPVPFGVGQLTKVSFIENVLTAYDLNMLMQ